MRKWILLTVFFLSVLAVALVFWPKKARCTYCPSYTCFSSAQCGYGCTCVTPPGQSGGQCWGVN